MTRKSLLQAARIYFGLWGALSLLLFMDGSLFFLFFAGLLPAGLIIIPLTADYLHTPRPFRWKAIGYGLAAWATILAIAFSLTWHHRGSGDAGMGQAFLLMSLMAWTVLLFLVVGFFRWAIRKLGVQRLLWWSDRLIVVALIVKAMWFYALPLLSRT